jgi:hypothetical protein
MSEHVPETCNESNGQWLPLIEYSVKSGVSLSTIRRKIKSNTIRYRLEKGRYLILFNEMNNLAARQPTPTSSEIGDWQNEPLHRIDQAGRREAVHRIDAYPPEAPRYASRPPVREEIFEEEREERTSELAFAEKAVKMVSDAFEHALKEKEERIRMLEKANQELEERLAELRTLVRVLEEKFQVRY